MSIAAFGIVVLNILIPRQDPTPIESEIVEVTVFSGSALVSRSAVLPSGRGLFVLQGLPLSMDPESVRVRCRGASVVAVDVRERQHASLSNERLQELRDRLRDLEREVALYSDERNVLMQVGQHLSGLLGVEARAHDREVSDGRVNPEAWKQNLAFLREQLLQNKTDLRENGWRIEQLSGQSAEIKRELGSHPSGSGVRLRDVHVAIDGGGQDASLELEYRVSNAGWSPLYDLRTAPNARSVELSYRARVWQQSGEDWEDCAVLLSTAQPQMGAQGPDPRPVWLRLHDPEVVFESPVHSRSKVDTAANLRGLGYVGESEGDDGPDEGVSFASVESQGLSVRFRIARRESIESRREPTNVLIGQSTLAVQPEYFATPALDTNVWLRGRTRNSSEWTLLPGRAAVYFGADFIGHAQLDLVQPGEEITLHLGPDPALSIERLQVEDLRKKSGIFSSRARQIDRWRIEITNHGAAAAAADGSARIFVREVIPRTTDNRIKVELGETRPKPSQGERWKREREEQGILTWPLSVPRGGKAEIIWETRISYPEGMQVLR